MKKNYNKQPIFCNNNTDDIHYDHDHNNNVPQLNYHQMVFPFKSHDFIHTISPRYSFSNKKNLSPRLQSKASNLINSNIIKDTQLDNNNNNLASSSTSFKNLNNNIKECNLLINHVDIKDPFVNKSPSLDILPFKNNADNNKCFEYIYNISKNFRLQPENHERPNHKSVVSANFYHKLGQKHPKIIDKPNTLSTMQSTSSTKATTTLSPHGKSTSPRIFCFRGDGIDLSSSYITNNHRNKLLKRSQSPIYSSKDREFTDYLYQSMKNIENTIKNSFDTLDGFKKQQTNPKSKNISQTFRGKISPSIFNTRTKVKTESRSSSKLKSESRTHFKDIHTAARMSLPKMHLISLNERKRGMIKFDFLNNDSEIIMNSNDDISQGFHLSKSQDRSTKPKSNAIISPRNSLLLSSSSIYQTSMLPTQLHQSIKLPYSKQKTKEKEELQHQNRSFIDKPDYILKEKYIKPTNHIECADNQNHNYNSSYQAKKSSKNLLFRKNTSKELIIGIERFLKDKKQNNENCQIDGLNMDISCESLSKFKSTDPEIYDEQNNNIHIKHDNE